MPSKHLKAGHHRSASEPPFQWRAISMAVRWQAVGGPILFAGWIGEI